MKHLQITKKDFNKTLSSFLCASSLIALNWNVDQECDSVKLLEITFIVQKCAGLLNYSLRVFANGIEEYGARLFSVNCNTTLQDVVKFLEEDC